MNPIHHTQSYGTEGVLCTDTAWRLPEKSKEFLAKWLSSFMGKEVNPADINLIESESTIWGSWDMEVLKPGQMGPKACISGYIMRFEYEGKPYAIHTDSYGNHMVNPLEAKLNDLKEKVRAQAFKAFIPEVTSARKRFCIKITDAKFIYKLNHFGAEYPLGMMVTAKFFQGQKKGTYTVITDMDGKRKMSEWFVSR